MFPACLVAGKCALVCILLLVNTCGTATGTFYEKYYLEDFSNSNNHTAYLNFGNTWSNAFRLGLVSYTRSVENDVWRMRAQAPLGGTVVVSVRYINLRREKRGQCDEHQFHIIDGHIDSGRNLTGRSGLCGSRVPRKTFASTQETMTLLFQSRAPRHRIAWSALEVVLTVAYYTPDGSCNGRDFQCRDVRRCIPSNRKCDGLSNCGDQSDETIRFAKCASWVGLIAGIVAVFLVLLAVATVAMFCCGLCYTCGKCRKNRQRQTPASMNVIEPMRATSIEMVPVPAVYAGPPPYAEQTVGNSSVYDVAPPPYSAALAVRKTSHS